MKVPNLRKIVEGYKGCKRVIRVSHKPDKSEYISISKIVGLGMVGMGVLGLLINLFFSYPGLFG